MENLIRMTTKDRPSKLDYLLAIIPIPVLGEKKASKVICYFLNKHYENTGKKVLEEQFKDQVIDGTVLTRVISYFGLPAFTYTIYQIIQH